jgi:DNA polymerase-3 subunit gamma/tau
VLAKALNCEKRISSTPCGTCSACIEVDEGRFVDLIEVDAASRTKVDETRELLENVPYAPARGRFKVYLIDEVHMFSNHSFNALLKTLEEPPPHVKFLLATTDPKRLPITILSRCLQFNLKRLGVSQIREQLQKILAVEGLAAEAAALSLIATAADGSMRDSLSLLDQAIAFTGGHLQAAEVASMLGTVASEQVLPLVAALGAGDGPALIAHARALAEFAPDFAQVLGEMLALLRRVAVAQALGDDPAAPDESDEIRALAAAISPEACQLYYQLGLLARRDLPLAPDPETGFEMALVRMLAFRPQEMATVPPAPDGTAPRRAPTTATRHGSGTDTGTAAARAAVAAAASPSPAARAAAPADAHATPTPAASPHLTPTESPGVPDTPDAVPVAALDWLRIVARLECSPLVRELARHCALESFDGRAVALALAPQHENLSRERQVRGLEQALRDCLQREVTVRVRIAAGPLATPARQQSDAEQSRQVEAARQIDADPAVRALRDQFDATIERVTPRDA